MIEEILKDQKQKLAERWSLANLQYELINTAQQKIKLSLFSGLALYNFAGYAQTDTWRSEASLQGKPPDDVLFFEYCYDADNTPVLVKKYFGRSVESVGIFIWSDTQWEYIEYSTRNNLCSSYSTIVFHNGRKTSFMSLQLNGGTFQFGVDNLNAVEMCKKLLENSYGFFAEISMYNYKDDIITTADSLNSTPGIGEFFSTDYYVYDSNGGLYKILSEYAGGETRITYIALSKRSVKTLINSVAKQLSEYLIKSVAQSGYKEKLSCLHLNYKYCSQYWPYIAFVSERDMTLAIADKDIIFPMGDTYENIKNTATEKLKEDFAELEQHILQNDDHELGRQMLLETAKMMAKPELEKVIPVSKNFFVFPMDWTLHSPPKEKLLKTCGASPAQLKVWNKLRWLER